MEKDNKQTVEKVLRAKRASNKKLQQAAIALIRMPRSGNFKDRGLRPYKNREHKVNWRKASREGGLGHASRFLYKRLRIVPVGRGSESQIRSKPWFRSRGCSKKLCFSTASKPIPALILLCWKWNFRMRTLLRSGIRGNMRANVGWIIREGQTFYPHIWQFPILRKDGCGAINVKFFLDGRKK